MIAFDPSHLDWQKMEGMLPVMVQDATTGCVLMHGYMTSEALQATLTTGQVTFYSRSKQRLWVKGETSGHFLQLKAIYTDCDNDALLLLAHPLGPTCHTGSQSCFGEQPSASWNFLNQLETVITSRQQERPSGHYTTSLFDKGLPAIAQKVGEEGVEVVIAALAQDDTALCNEAADLLFHLLVLLRARELNLDAVIQVLQAR